VPFTPGGAGVQQALLVKVFATSAPTAVVAAYSVGQQIAIAAFTASLGLAAISSSSASGHSVKCSTPAARRGTPRGPPSANGNTILSRTRTTSTAVEERTRRRGAAGDPAGALLKALSGLPHQRDRLREDQRDHGADLLGLRLRVACTLIRWTAATVMSTASLIALSAQTSFWLPDICSANSARRL